MSQTVEVRFKGTRKAYFLWSGEEPLRLAKRVRREALRLGGSEALREAVQRHFGMPASPLRYATTLPEPLYVPARSESS